MQFKKISSGSLLNVRHTKWQRLRLMRLAAAALLAVFLLFYLGSMPSLWLGSHESLQSNLRPRPSWVSFCPPEGPIRRAECAALAFNEWQSYARESESGLLSTLLAPIRQFTVSNSQLYNHSSMTVGGLACAGLAQLADRYTEFVDRAITSDLQAADESASRSFSHTAHVPAPGPGIMHSSDTVTVATSDEYSWVQTVLDIRRSTTEGTHSPTGNPQPSRRRRVLFAATMSSYNKHMDRWFYQLFYDANRVPGWEAFIWGPGMPGYNASLTLGQNLQLNFPGDGVFDAVFFMYTFINTKGGAEHDTWRSLPGRPVTACIMHEISVNGDWMSDICQWMDILFVTYVSYLPGGKGACILCEYTCLSPRVYT